MGLGNESIALGIGWSLLYQHSIGNRHCNTGSHAVRRIFRRLLHKYNTIITLPSPFLSCPSLIYGHSLPSRFPFSRKSQTKQHDYWSHTAYNSPQLLQQGVFFVPPSVSIRLSSWRNTHLGAIPNPAAGCCQHFQV